MADYTWTIDTGRTDGGIVANARIQEGQIPTTPNYRRGGSVSLRFGFWDESGLDPAIDRYKALREYGDYAGAVAVETSVQGEAYVTERLDPAAPVDSLIVDVVPGADVDHTPGLWVAITGIEDQTTIPEDMAVLQVQADVIAEASDYADRSALLNDRGGGL